MIFTRRVLTMKQNVTMQQIAAEAGVSTATVSRVLTGHPLVSEATRIRVQGIIDKYHYTPNSMARSLVCRRSNTLGLLVQDVSNPYFARMYIQAEQHAAASGYTLMMFSTQSQESEQASVQRLVRHGVDGIAMASATLDTLEINETMYGVVEELSARLPIVLINDPVARCHVPFVDAMHYEGYVSAVKYLLALGHRRIAFVGGQEENRSACTRRRAYADTLAAHGVAVDPRLVHLSGFDAEDGARAMARLLAGDNVPTAVICYSDLSAMGVMQVCHQQRLRIPDDLSIISCDNTYLSRIGDPMLTSIDIHPGEQGREAIRLLLQMIGGGEVPPETRIASDLVIRGSTGRVPEA